MRIGVPRETLRHEHRVGLTPFGVSRFVHRGHEVYVERDAGKDSHFSDEDYVGAGATIVYRPEEVYGRAEVVCRVSSLNLEEVQLLAPGSTILGFHHLAVAPRPLLDQLLERQITAIGYELLECDTEECRRPVLTSQSEIAGRLAVTMAARLLEHEEGGRGIILGGVAGVPPATVVILGAGTVGLTAAKVAGSLGAHVIVLDSNPQRLRVAISLCSQHLATAVASPRNLRRYTAIADVLIGAVMIPGGRTPYLVTEQMVGSMKRGSVILDVSIDQGGCVETSRPTSLDSPTFKVSGVTHYCVPNMTTNVPRTASRSLTIASITHLLTLADAGLDKALTFHPGLARGVYLYRGKIVNEAAARSLGLDHSMLEDLLP